MNYSKLDCIFRPILQLPATKAPPIAYNNHAGWGFQYHFLYFRSLDVSKTRMREIFKMVGQLFFFEPRIRNILPDGGLFTSHHPRSPPGSVRHPSPAVRGCARHAAATTAPPARAPGTWTCSAGSKARVKGR